MNQNELIEEISAIKDKITSIEGPFDNRIFLLCESEKSKDINKYLFENLGLRFIIATGIDSDHYFEILYHFSNDQTGTVVTVKSHIRDKKNPVVDSIATFLPGAEWIEREIHDILGIEFRGHPNMKRLILSDSWPQGVYPMRKEVKK